MSLSAIYLAFFLSLFFTQWWLHGVVCSCNMSIVEVCCMRANTCVMSLSDAGCMALVSIWHLFYFIFLFIKKTAVSFIGLPVGDPMNGRL